MVSDDMASGSTRQWVLNAVTVNTIPMGSGEVPQRLRVLAALAEDLASSRDVHGGSQPSLASVLGRLLWPH